MTDTLAPLTLAQTGGGGGGNLPHFTRLEIEPQDSSTILLEIPGGTKGLFDAWYVANLEGSGDIIFTMDSRNMVYPRPPQGCNPYLLYEDGPATLSGPIQCYVQAGANPVPIHYVLTTHTSSAVLWWRVVPVQPPQTSQPT